MSTQDLAKAIEDSLSEAKFFENHEVKDKSVESLPEKEIQDSEKSETKEPPKEEKKDYSYQGRINFLTKKLKEAEEKARELEQKIQSPKESTKEESIEKELPEIETTDDFIKFVDNNYVPKSEIDALFQKKIEELQAKEFESKAKQEFSELQVKIEELYKHRFNPEVGAYDDEAYEETDFLNKTYWSNPTYWKTQIDKEGLESVVKRLLGKEVKPYEKSEKKLDTSKIEKANTLSSDTARGETKLKTKSNSYNDIIAEGMRQLRKD